MQIFNFIIRLLIIGVIYWFIVMQVSMYYGRKGVVVMQNVVHYRIIGDNETADSLKVIAYVYFDKWENIKKFVPKITRP